MPNLVSVYIPTKNRVDLLRRAIHSVLAQTVRNIEIIVVSDGSTDGTCEFVRSIQSDIEIRLIERQASAGACQARNEAIEIARGELITGLDDDDMFLPHRIESFLQAWTRLEAQGQKFSCLFDRRIVDRGQNLALWDTEVRVNLPMMLKSNEIGNQIFTRTETLKAAGFFDSRMPVWQDWEFWTRVVRMFGDALNIHRNSYVMDMAHNLERISYKPAQRVVEAARIFYSKHCKPAQRAGILVALGNYATVDLTIGDLLVIMRSEHFRIAIKTFRSGRYKRSMVPSLGAS